MKCFKKLGMTCSCIACINAAAHAGEQSRFTLYAQDDMHRESENTDPTRQQVLRVTSTSTATAVVSASYGFRIGPNGEVIFLPVRKPPSS